VAGPGRARRGEVWLARVGEARQGVARFGWHGWHGNNNERKGNDMSGIPRYQMTNNLGELDTDNGAWVRFEDHVAAVKATTATALQEECGAYDHGYCIGYAAGYSRGIAGIGKGLGDYCQVDECAGCGE